MTLFSIITISYQNLDGLRETVESVAAQTFRDFEHIVVDGGSTDGSKDWLAKNFRGDWTSEPDGGRYDAMNKGANRATGEYLWFLHSGDVFGDTTVLQRVADAIQTAPEGPPEWLYGLARVVHPDGTLQGIIGFAPFTMFNFAILQRPLPHQATAIRTALFRQLGGYDLHYPVSGDQVLLMKAANVCPPLALADFLCDFDSTGLSANRSWWQTWKDDYATLGYLDRPVTGSRRMDRLLTLLYSSFRQLARSARDRAVALKATS
ncbi:MAG: glycosyltransferase family 2 protein [Actinomycetota bacterium]